MSSAAEASGLFVNTALSSFDQVTNYSIKLHLDVLKFELAYNKTNQMTRAPSEDSDQPGHPPSLIRVFAVSINNHLILSYP